MLVVSLFAAACHAQQEARTVPAVKAGAPPVIDGVLDDPCWKDAPLADSFTNAFSMQPMSDGTESWITYDEAAIYVAFRCHDAKPDELIGREIRPGAQFTGEDYVAFFIDPYFTRQHGSRSAFRVNLLGTQSDEIAGGRADKREWRGLWKAATKRLDDGYSVEMAIPWKVINYPSGGPRDMTINFARAYGRQATSTLWSNMTGASRPELEGIWKGVVAPKSTVKPVPQFLAYGLGEVDNGKVRADAGLDVRYAPTPTYTLVGSANPDFKNVEQSIASIEFTRSEQFLEDRRPFFAEGSMFFQGMTQEFGIGRLFYSRRIRDIDFGAKGYGRIDPTFGLGVLTTYGNDGETNAVANATKQFGGNTAIGGFAVSHAGSGSEDLVVGGSGTHRMGNYFVSAEYAREQRNGTEASASSFSALYQVPRIVSELRYSTVDPQFDPALGLIPFNDRRGGYWYTEYNDQYQKTWINRGHAELYCSQLERFDGSLLERGFDAQLVANSRDDQQFRLGHENFNYEGRLDRVYRVAYVTGLNNRFRRIGVIHRFGKRGADDYRFWALEMTRRMGGRIDLGISYVRQEYLGDEEQLILTAAWEIDAKRSFAGRLVRSGGSTNGYLAYRSSGFAGKELYVILGDPNASKFQTRAAVKLVWPF